MFINVGCVETANQIQVYSVNTQSNSIESKKADTHSISEENLNLLLLNTSEDLSSIQNILNKEDKFYPIINLDALNLDIDAVQMMEAIDFEAVYSKVSARWILNNNIKAIEQLYPTISYLKDLWVKDRNTFFEELWFLLKTNMATTELSMIFHDLKEPTKKQEEKGEKPVLCYSKVIGTKVPNIVPGDQADTVLMKEYTNDFTDQFHITEYSKDKGQIVACAKINLSPVLIMANLPNLNQLQQSVLIALFTGLQAE